MGYARFQMTPELLREALHLPRDAQIVRVLTVEDSVLIEVTVYHDDLTGCMPPMVRPEFKRIEPSVVLTTWGKAEGEEP